MDSVSFRRRRGDYDKLMDRKQNCRLAAVKWFFSTP